MRHAAHGEFTNAEFAHLDRMIDQLGVVPGPVLAETIDRRAVALGDPRAHARAVGEIDELAHDQAMRWVDAQIETLAVDLPALNRVLGLGGSSSRMIWSTRSNACSLSVCFLSGVVPVSSSYINTPSE